MRCWHFPSNPNGRYVYADRHGWTSLLCRAFSEVSMGSMFWLVTLVGYFGWLGLGANTTAWAQAENYCQEPNVLLVIDTSGSMAEQNKIQVLRTTLVTVVRRFQKEIRFGLLHFSNRSAILNVPIGPKEGDKAEAHIQRILAAVKALQPLGDTPMVQAMTKAQEHYKNDVIPHDFVHKLPERLAKRPHYVVLMTDGEPTDGDPVGVIGLLRSLSVGEKTYDIRTFVIGFGKNEQIRAFRLNQFAQRGGTRRFFHAKAATDLEQAFLAILNQVKIRQESCNNFDDNCDGKIDEGVQRECRGDCGVGTQICQGGKWPSTCNVPPAQEEVCDGYDNDCDGRTDEELQRDCSNACGQGVQRCVFGDWSACDAPRPEDEICDGKDNDCNGKIDEKVTSCPGGRCVAKGGTFGCEIACRKGECPAGFLCNSSTSQCEELPCRQVRCAPGLVCVNLVKGAKCQDFCQGVECPSGRTCGRDGTCINCYEHPCAPGMVCREGRCVVDKCATVRCAVGQACSDGVCFDPCPASCPSGQRCQTLSAAYPKSLCFPDICANVKCPAKQLCRRGKCVSNRCVGVRCGTKQVCEPTTGACLDDPCLWTHCPEGMRCQAGECVKGEPSAVHCPGITRGQCCKDAHCGEKHVCKNGFCVSQALVSEGGTSHTGQSNRPGPGASAGGCACSSGAVPWPSLGWWFWLGGLGLWSRRQRRGRKWIRL